MKITNHNYFGISLFSQPNKESNTLTNFVKNYVNILHLKGFDKKSCWEMVEDFSFLLFEDIVQFNCEELNWKNEYDSRNLLYPNKNFLIKEEVKDLASKISLSNFTLNYLNKLPNQKSTYLLDGKSFYRFWKEDNILMGGLFTKSHKENNYTSEDIKNLVLELNRDISLEDVETNPVLRQKLNNQISEIIQEQMYGFEYSLFKFDLLSRNISVNGDVYENLKDVEDNDSLSYSILKPYLQTLLYVCLSELNIEILPPNTKTKGSRKSGKIVNSSKSEIIVVGSKWNTISIRTEGFNVSGHFRLQPCGKDRKDVKLIWIDGFEKNGYIKKSNKSIKAY